MDRSGVALLVWLLAACSSSAESAADSAELGAATFRDACARCHGKRGQGGAPMTADGLRPRDLTDPAWQATRTDQDLELVVREGKPPMPPFKEVLTPEQIRAVVATIRRLEKGAK